MAEQIELRKVDIDEIEENGNGHVRDHDLDLEYKRPETKDKNPHSVSWRWAIILLAGGCLLYYVVHLNDHALPRVVTIDEVKENPLLFSGERSRESLRKIAGLGPRVVGHVANEVLTPQIIEEEVREAIRKAHPSQLIQIKRQIGSGAYQLGFIPSFTNIYVNVQNVLVRVEGSDGQHSILVNCHYDTVPEVDGASDDAISCAVMLELIRVLSANTQRLKHNVVFLFNGAEEVPVQGSHLFLQHEWKQQCRLVLNLEAAGLGGRSILFQSGPQHSWIFNYYAKYAPHPHAQVLAEEMFQAGLIPSDTDFRIFRDFGNLPGLDFAFSRNGHVYHTKYDAERYIPAGSHQHMGDNTLALLRTIGNAPEVENMEANSGGTPVFYDYLGWFLISYSYGGSVAINIITIAIAIFSVVVFVGRLMRWSWLPESTHFEGKKFEKITLPTIIDKFKPKSNTRAADNQQQHHQTYVPAGEFNQNDVRKRGKSQDESANHHHHQQQQLAYDETRIDAIKRRKHLCLEESNHRLNTYKAILIEFGIAVGAVVIGMGAAVGVTLLIALIVNAAAPLAMPWYNNIWLLFPLYWCPCLIIYALVPHLVDVWRAKTNGLPLNIRTQMNLMATFVPWILVYFIGMCAGIRTTSVFFIPTLFTSMAHLIIHLTPLYNTVHKWVWVYLVVHIPVVLWTMYLALLGYITFLPVMARSGVINGDVNIALITCLFCFLITSVVMPFMTLIRRPGMVFMFLGLFSLIMIVISLSTDIGFPYEAGPGEPKPQRYWIMHTLREFRNEQGQVRRSETGYWVLNLDENSPYTIPLKKRSGLISLKDDCNTELYCGLPLYMTRMVPLSPTSSWIPADPPIQPVLTELELKKRECSHNRCTLLFILKGPDRMTLTFAPREGAELVEWSVPSGIEASGEWKSRPTYYLHIVRGKIESDYELSLIFTVNATQTGGSPILDVGLAGNHVHYEDQRTKAFQDFLDSLPDWTMRTGWISAYKGYVF